MAVCLITAFLVACDICRDMIVLPQQVLHLLIPLLPFVPAGSAALQVRAIPSLSSSKVQSGQQVAFNPAVKPHFTDHEKTIHIAPSRFGSSLFLGNTVGFEKVLTMNMI